MAAAPVLLLLATTLPAVPQTSDPALRVRPPETPRTVAVAFRAPAPPVIDGRDLDPIWAGAAVITEFREFTPREDGEPRFRTEARVAYDARNLYVFVRAFDPAPDSILRLLSRRDVRSASDQIKVVVDSYHDRRSGFEFAVNPAGVKRDFAIYDDGAEDDAWDGVWEVGTAVDSLGWTAEFRIPLSQLRYARRDTNTFGFGVWRDIERHTERVSWPLYRPSRPGLSSQLGELTGLTGLAAPRRVELLPYAIARSAERGGADGFERYQQLSAGADLKLGLGPNLTLDGTVNPDFGQVEADPAVLNLGAFETFFQERRPFFVEGTGIFDVSVNCNVVNCSGESLFYSRRIGRAPQAGGLYGDETSPLATTILGAAKLTGRLPGGTTVGLLEAVTGREVGAEDRTIEPLTNYSALRLQQDFRQGSSGIGLMLTGVTRNLDQWTEDLLRRDAYVGAVDFRHRFLANGFEIRGKLDLSRVSGSAAAMDATQRSAVHNYQRPDADLGYDPARTTLWGDAEELQFGKISGMWRFETSYQRRSPGFELNDLGFLRRGDQQSWSTWTQLRFLTPTRVYRQIFWNANWWMHWTTDGMPQERAFNTNAHAQLQNRWWLHAGGTLGQLGATYCDRCARGGPALRNSPAMNVWGGVEGDSRHAVTPFLWSSYFRGDQGRSRSWDVSPEVNLRVASRLNASLAFSVSGNTDDAQWYGNLTDSTGVTHYTFAHLDQITTALTGRLDFTFAPTLSLQVYAQPFVTKGTYQNVRELDEPRAADYDDRFRPYDDAAVAADPGGFNFKQFRSNVVLRWEYRPGSALYLVWATGRAASEPLEGDRTIGRNFRDLFGLPSNDTFLIKGSYWINW
jgi:Domain of unknown function (DUF5916)/Carbohydrate family 9 binding domain-like